MHAVNVYFCVVSIHYFQLRALPKTKHACAALDLPLEWSVTETSPHQCMKRLLLECCCVHIFITMEMNSFWGNLLMTLAENKLLVFSLGLVLDVEGDWDITASVHGVPVAGMPLRVKASYPSLCAADCELSMIDTATPICAGVQTRLTVQAKGVEKTRRMFSGAESIAVITVDDAGHQVRVPIVLEDKGMLATAILIPLLPGRLKVTIVVNGEPLTGSPMNVRCNTPLAVDVFSLFD